MAMYFAIQSGGLMRELNRALADILEIRAKIATGTSFRGYGPTTIAATGVIGLLTAALQAVRPDIFAASATHFILCWLAASVICAITVRIEMQGALAPSPFQSCRCHDQPGDRTVHAGRRRRAFPASVPAAL
jgi:hypothetical protein